LGGRGLCFLQIVKKIDFLAMDGHIFLQFVKIAVFRGMIMSVFCFWLSCVFDLSHCAYLQKYIKNKKFFINRQ